MTYHTSEQSCGRRALRTSWRDAALQINQMDFRFFFIFAFTVLMIRTVLYFHPVPAPTIGGLRTHHYMYGAIAMLIGLATKSISLYAVGMGLFIDELTFLFTGGRTHQDNYSSVSLLGTAILVGLVFVLRGYLARPFEG